MRELVVAGRVVAKESQQGTAELVVLLLWTGDAGSEVHGGSAITDATGRFSIETLAPDGPSTARVRVLAPDGSASKEPLAESPPRVVDGKREEFFFWIAEATLAEAGVPRPVVDRATTVDPTVILQRVVLDQQRRDELDQGAAAVLVPRLDEHRERGDKLRAEVRTRLLAQLGVERPGRTRVVGPTAPLADVVASAARDALQIVQAGRPNTARLAISAAALDALRIEPGTNALHAGRVEDILFAGGTRARVREDAIARYCAQLTYRLPPLDEPAPPPTPPPTAPQASSLEETLSTIVDEIARRTAPVIEPRSDQGSVGQRLRALDLVAGPADRTAFFDYGTLVGTIDGVWQELMDEDVVSAAVDVSTAITSHGGRVDGGTSFVTTLANELHALSAVATGVVKAKRPPSNFSAAIGEAFPQFVGALPRQQVQDHRGEQPPVVSCPSRSRPPLWSEAPPTPDYDALLQELNERLLEPYTFQVFAASGEDRAFDYGLFATYRQRWEPRGHQAGSLVKTVTLAPREERTYVTRTTYKRASSSVNASTLERSDRTETQDSMRSASDIVAAAKSSLGFEVTLEGSVGIGELFSADQTTKVTQASEQSSQETRQLVREGVRRAAQEAKSSTRTEVTTSESLEAFSEESGKISNPNEELPVTYLFYELQRRFRVSERVHRVVPVVMVARAVPAPHQITRGWLFTHGWILRRALKDEQFAGPLAYLLHEAAGVEARLGQLREHRDGMRRLVDTLTGEVERRTHDATSRYGSVTAALNTRLNAERREGEDGFIEMAADAVLGGDNSVEVARLREQMARDAYEQALRAERDARDRLSQAATSLDVATKEHSDALARFRDSETGVTRLRVHVKQHILHYMRAIWNAEDRDQRFFELHDVRVPRLAGHLEYNLVERPNTPPVPPLWTPPYTIEGTLVSDEPDPMNDTVRLGDIADLDQPIGYKGNFQVFPLRQHNVLTRFLMLPYLDHRVGACDPELLANFTVSELDAYVACARASLPRADFEAILPAIHELYRALLDRPFPDEEEVVVPSQSTFIEALPGTRPVLEDYRLLHRAIDVSQAAAQVRKRELDNLRRVALIRAGQLSDPDIETMIVTPPETPQVVNASNGTPEEP